MLLLSFLRLSFCNSIQCTCFSFSASSGVLYFIFCRLFALFSLRFPASLTLVSHGNVVAVPVFVFQFCCFTSAKSAADVHIIPYNTPVINHAALVHRPRCGHMIWPYKWPTYDIRFMDINRQRLQSRHRPVPFVRTVKRVKKCLFLSKFTAGIE